jgi:hypothetical protein
LAVKPCVDLLNTVFTKSNNNAIKDNCKYPWIKPIRMGWAGHVACMGEGRGAYRITAGRPEGRRPIETARSRWEDNIKMDL